MCPKVCLVTRDVCFEVQNRSRGGLTGSRVAGGFGRVPVETVLAERAHAWRQWGFGLGNDTCLMYLYSSSGTVHGAISMLEDAACHLHSQWGHEIKDSSRSVMACSGNPELSPDPSRWPLVDSFECLGHILQSDCGIRACFSNVKRSLWGAFWGNCGHNSAKGLPLAAKCCLMSHACNLALLHRCSRWPPQPTIAAELDRVQSKMVAVLLQVGRLPGESADVFCRRRNRRAGEACAKIGKWSLQWFERAKAWNAHIARGHNPYSWPSLLKPFHDVDWLEEQRFLSSRQGTSTRLARGRPHSRWDESIASLPA